MVHSTEDQAKVEAAVARVLSVAAQSDVERFEGHFGNEILRVRLHFVGDEAGKAFENIVGKLPRNLRNYLVRDITPWVDEHSALFLRFDKQLLVKGSLGLDASDPVRVKVKPRSFQIKGSGSQFFANLIGGK
jgi:RNA binding exosome subunit